MKKAILLPRKYIIGRGIINEIGSYAAMLGKKAVVMWGKRTKESSGEAVLQSLKAAGVEVVDVIFNGECTKAEVTRIAGLAKGSDMVIGLGGGKAIDAAKGAAIFAKLPHIIVPTIASNDSPTSACTVWYDEHGVCVGFDLWPSNPDYILVDTEIIVKAPIRYFIAGIGDAMATWFEAEASYQSRAVTCSGGIPTLTAMAMAKLCYEILTEYGLQAIEDVKVHAVTPAVEKVIEASTLLSGIGWESGGLATAHTLGNGLPVLAETHPYMHGEKVSFGLMTQLCLDDSLSIELVEKTAIFLVKAGLPVTLGDIGLGSITREKILEFAVGQTGAGAFVHNHNFKVSAGDLADAMIAADALGKKIKAQVGK
ncbi:MAG: glycerol dehydrogenase [Treponema sp.]|jgi:glycerol dehydrogenase|nr:glycerol dehydrogenase [Treponema sp.]